VLTEIRPTREQQDKHDRGLSPQCLHDANCGEGEGYNSPLGGLAPGVCQKGESNYPSRRAVGQLSKMTGLTHGSKPAYE